MSAATYRKLFQTDNDPVTETPHSTPTSVASDTDSGWVSIR